MRPAVIPGHTRVLGQPKDWDEKTQGKCLGLAVRDEEQEGMHALVSHWEPTPRELEVLLLGGKVQLTVMSCGHPPVRLEVANPPELGPNPDVA